MEPLEILPWSAMADPYLCLVNSFFLEPHTEHVPFLYNPIIFTFNIRDIFTLGFLFTFETITHLFM